MKYKSISHFLLIVVFEAFASYAEETNKTPNEVTLYSHSGHYTMSPAPTLHSDIPRIRIVKVELVKGPSDKLFTKITYTPHYGKISSDSEEFRKENETQSISILAPGDYTDKIQEGMILRMCYYPN